MSRFRFRFDRLFRAQLAVVGVTSKTAWVDVGDDLAVRFGPWSLRTPLANVKGVQRSGPYKWYRAIGPHLSLADRGATFGTTTAGGLCVLFHEPVGGLLPWGLLEHPGLTVTPEDIAGLEQALST